MDYGMIGKIEKAKRYAEEPERFRFDDFTVRFDGDNNGHTVTCAQGDWQCDCEFSEFGTLVEAATDLMSHIGSIGILLLMRFRILLQYNGH